MRGGPSERSEYGCQLRVPPKRLHLLGRAAAVASEVCSGLWGELAPSKGDAKIDYAESVRG